MAHRQTRIKLLRMMVRVAMTMLRRRRPDKPTTHMAQVAPTPLLPVDVFIERTAVVTLGVISAQNCGLNMRMRASVRWISMNRMAQAIKLKTMVLCVRNRDAWILWIRSLAVPRMRMFTATLYWRLPTVLITRCLAVTTPVVRSMALSPSISRRRAVSLSLSVSCTVAAIWLTTQSMAIRATALYARRRSTMP